ncbi:MAG: hypothetical protein K5909_04155 [Bacteroidales bacterium]|jgi:hypothetical protein|nr:hypothetical protein [Bacteroidales bacterium]MBR3500858.1 hypothetical protein [Bacteroidales bacterium]MCR4910454.1 hypothetical protein [Bacteroidales bacterium]
MKTSAKIDPLYLARERAALRHKHRKTVLFNDREVAAIEEYCKVYHISSKSAMFRQAIMERVLEGLDELHPTLF